MSTCTCGDAVGKWKFAFPLSIKFRNVTRQLTLFQSGKRPYQLTVVLTNFFEMISAIRKLHTGEKKRFEKS